MSALTKTPAYYGMEIPFHPLKTEHAPATRTISNEETSSYSVTPNLTPNCQPIPVRVSYRHNEKMAKCIERSNIIIPCLPMNW